ncbi:MAG: A24 family peptidase C-terminal domain-containing protein [archaeon]
MIEAYFLKVIAFALILWVLGLFGRQSIFLYVLFSSVSFFVRPVEAMPEFMISAIFVFLFLYVISTTVRNSFRSGFLRFSKHALLQSYRKRSVVYSVFVVSFLMMLAGIGDRTLLFLGSFFGFLALGLLSKSVSFARYDCYGIINYRNAFIAALFYAAYHSMYMEIFVGMIIGILYLALIVISSLVYDTFTFECPVGALKEGMVSADYVVKKDGRVYRKELNNVITLQSFLRRRIMLRAEGEEIVISPLRALSKKDIDFLKNMKKGREFDSLCVQNTVDMRAFVVGGIILSTVVFYIYPYLVVFV